MSKSKSSRHAVIIPEFVDLKEEVRIPKALPNPVEGNLRQYALRVPEAIEECSGIMVFGKKIKSLVFSTDLAIIKNINADAVLAVYPFTPQPIIAEALLLASDIPVFVGVGGGITQGKRVINLAMFAEINFPLKRSHVSVKVTDVIPAEYVQSHKTEEIGDRVRESLLECLNANDEAVSTECCISVK